MLFHVLIPAHARVGQRTRDVNSFEHYYFRLLARPPSLTSSNIGRLLSVLDFIVMNTVHSVQRIRLFPSAY